MSQHGTSRPDANLLRPAVPFMRGNLSAAMLTHLADALSVPDGGFSINVRTGREARSGYAVAVHPALERRIARRVTSSDIRSYIAEHEALLAEPGVVLGGWRSPDDGLAYLDISVVVLSRQFAMLLGAACGQTAVWDFENCESVSVHASAHRIEADEQLTADLASATPLGDPTSAVRSQIHRADALSRFTVLLGHDALEPQTNGYMQGGAP